VLRGHRATTGHAGGGRDDVAPPRRPSLRAPPPPRGVCARHPPSHRCPTCCCVILKRKAHLQEVVDDAQQLRSSASRFRARMWGGDVNGHSSALVTFVRRESAPAWKFSSCGGPASGAREGGGRAPSARALGTRCGRQAAPATLRSASDHRRRGRTRAPSALRRCAASVLQLRGNDGGRRLRRGGRPSPPAGGRAARATPWARRGAARACSALSSAVTTTS